MYNIIADLHTHTLACTHAYSTAAEMINSAKSKGLYAIGITDHARSMPGAPGVWYFECLDAIPKTENGVRVFKGIELNVIDFDGNTDYENHFNLDYTIASIHNIQSLDLKNPTIEKCTNAYINLANNPKINIIGHSGTKRFEYDYEKVIPIFGQTNTLVEINSGSFIGRKESIPNCKKIAELCKKHSVPIVVNSDAHYHTDVANFSLALEMLKEIDFPEELIANSSVERLSKYFK
ncbi:MAG: phosphatase [Clostridia bacterium]